MKKTVLILLLITSLFTINIQAADNEEWIWVYSDDYQSFYVDKNSVKYYKRQEAASFLGEDRNPSRQLYKEKLRLVV